ncbi:MAG: aminodeoxychorismate synthase component I [Burkholderiales bacterium]
MFRIADLPYHADSTRLFEPIADLPWSVFLDSGSHHPGQSRYDILAAEPYVTLQTRGRMTEVRTEVGGRESVQVLPDDPLALLRRHLGPAVRPQSALPFWGGAIGYFGYDLARRFDKLHARAADAEKLPEMAIGLYDWAAVVDHVEQRAWLVGGMRDPRTAERWDALLARFTETGERQRAPFIVGAPATSNLNEHEYAQAFHRIQEYIHAGDCYQINLAQRFAAPVAGDPWLAYQALRVINPAPYSAYLNTPQAQILSASPERFLKLERGEVETRPIKGTRPRAGHARLDAELAEELRTSEKDRAENVMIVDLLRNDLSKVCAPHSVRVPRLFEVESYATVHHLVSTVTGTLAPDRDALDLLRACFPGGSITGAPKRRAMQIIEELEPHRRGVYCGAIGYVGFNGNMDLNIAIRTMVVADGTARFWAGGGIVADSQLDAEYRETFDKARALLRLLEQSAVPQVAR